MLEDRLLSPSLTDHEHEQFLHVKAYRGLEQELNSIISMSRGNKESSVMATPCCVQDTTVGANFKHRLDACGCPETELCNLETTFTFHMAKHRFTDRS